MKARFAYEAQFDPPAPVVPVRISGPASKDAVLLPMLVDTGADCTLLPVSIVRQLGLPEVNTIRLRGVGALTLRATKHAAVIELGGLRLATNLAAFLDEAILGRDVLNQVVVTLDGPGSAILVQERVSTRGRRRST